MWPFIWNDVHTEADVNHDEHITYTEFENMYKRLLKAYYEPEVLELDLDRAIAVMHLAHDKIDDNSISAESFSLSLSLSLSLAGLRKEI